MSLITRVSDQAWFWLDLSFWVLGPYNSLGFGILCLYSSLKGLICCWICISLICDRITWLVWSSSDFRIWVLVWVQWIFVFSAFWFPRLYTVICCVARLLGGFPSLKVWYCLWAFPINAGVSLSLSLSLNCFFVWEVSSSCIDTYQ